MRRLITSIYVITLFFVLPARAIGPSQSMTRDTIEFLERNSLCKTAVQQIISLKYDWRKSSDLHVIRVALSPDGLLSVLPRAGVDEEGVKKIGDAFRLVIKNASDSAALKETVDAVFVKGPSYDNVKPLFCMGLTCGLLEVAGESIQFPLNYVITPLETSEDLDIKKALPLDPIPDPAGGMLRIEPILLNNLDPNDPTDLRAWLTKFFMDSSDFASNRLLSEWIGKNNVRLASGKKKSVDPIFHRYIKILGHVVFIDPKFYYTFVVSRRFEVVLAMVEILQKSPLTEEENKKIREQTLQAVEVKAGSRAIAEFQLNKDNVLETGKILSQELLEFNKGLQAVKH